MPEPITQDPPTIQEISDAMKLAGGSFIRNLGPCLPYADERNLAKLKAAFPEEWAHYTRMALAFREKAQTEIADPL